jgi:hypothetical protein
VRPPLTPVDASIGESPAQRAQRIDIDSHCGQRLEAFRGHLVAILDVFVGAQPLQFLESIAQQYGRVARHVIVTGARGA